MYPADASISDSDAPLPRANLPNHSPQDSPAVFKTTPTQTTDPALIISQLRSWAEEQPDSDLARILDSTIEEIEALNLMRGGQDRQRVKDALDTGNWTVAHLREATGLTDFAVRRELRRLESEGMVRRDQSGRAELFVPV